MIHQTRIELQTDTLGYEIVAKFPYPVIAGASWDDQTLALLADLIWLSEVHQIPGRSSDLKLVTHKLDLHIEH